MAKLYPFPGKHHASKFEVSSGSTLTIGQHPVLEKTSSTFDQQYESLLSSGYLPETIVGLPLLIKSITNIYERCKSHDWDGDGAIGIPIAAYMHALRLASNIPPELKLPSAHPDSDGYIELEWYQAGKTFSILVGARPILFWAGYYSDDKRRSGREPFNGIFPTDLIVEVQKVYA